MGSQSQYKIQCLKQNLISGTYQRGKNNRWYRQYCRNYANGFISESDKQFIENL